ncbi:MAG TPA: Yip1 family protein [Gemmatimonadales bacterium]|nr:Yip1 family protein [Gemmatimonadales bacterium]
MTAIPTPPPLSPDAPAAWEDLLEIFYAPSAVFERRKASPKFWLAFAVVSVLVAVVLFAGKGLLQPAFDAEFARGMAQAIKNNPQLTPDQVEKGRGIATTFSTMFLGLGAPIAMLALGPIIWLCGKMVGAVEDVTAAWMIAALAYLPRILGAVAMVVQPLLMPPEKVTGFASLSIGPARFLDPDTSSKLLTLITTRLDLFTIWSTVIIAIGLKVTGKVSTAKAWTATAVVWLIPMLFGLIGVLRAK